VPHVLITPDYPTNAVIGPLQDHGCRVIVVGNARDLAYLKPFGCAFLEPDSFIGPEGVGAAVAQVRVQLEQDQRFQWQGRPLRLGGPEDWRVLESTVNRAFGLTRAVRELHARDPLDLVVVHEEISAENCALLTFARRHGVPSLHIPHGAWLYRGLHDRANPHALPLADYQTLAGEGCLFGLPCPPARDLLAITGNPEFDRYSTFDLRWERALARRRMGVSGVRPVVSFLSSAAWCGHVEARQIEEAIERSYRAVLRASRALGFDVVCKLHPASDDALHDRVENEVGTAPVARSRTDFQACVAVADLVVVHGPSNGVIEAVLMGQPTIVIDGFEGAPAVWSVRSDSAAIEAALAEALAGDSLGKFRARLAEGRDEFIRRYNVANDGAAAERVADVASRVAGATAGAWRVRWTRAVRLHRPSATWLRVRTLAARGRDRLRGFGSWQ